MSKEYPSQLLDRFVIRMPDGMRDKIEELAKGNNRSMNAEILSRLEASFTLDEQKTISSENTHKALGKSTNSPKVDAKSLFDDVEFKFLLANEVQKELDKRLSKDAK